MNGNTKSQHPYLLALLLLLPLVGSSQSETRIQSGAYGYSFAAPAGWVHQDMKNGSHVFGSNSIPGIVAVIHHDYDSKEEVKAYAQINGIQEEGMSLTLLGEIDDFSSNGIIGTFNGTLGGSTVKAAVVSLFSPHGGGVSVFAATAPEAFDDSYLTLVKATANSVQFARLVESNLVRQWKNGLSNKKLTYYNTTSNMAEKSMLFLYENGWFIYADESSYSSTDYSSTFSSASTSENGGKWNVTGDEREVQLQLTFNDGSTYLYPLDLKEGSATQVLINGQRYFTEDL
ncbi:MAG: hypothetical protein AAFN92_02665 [Bacteroidota bacterium]